jgi:DNA repair protein RecN (Recombination protein N)
MMLRLQIENLALIERAELELSPGLNVFSGETGAGKTMLAQAIGLLAGGQPASALVGPHAEEAYVEAEFELPEGLLDEPELAALADLRPEDEETLVVARRLFRSGRSRALVWGRSCARADLESLGERLLEVSSQHEARRLARPAEQLALLDAHAGLDIAAGEMAEAWRALREARAALSAAEAGAEDAARRRQQLEDLAARVEELAVGPAERESLEAERLRLRHLDELTGAIAGAAELLSPEDGDGALAAVAGATELVAGAVRFEPPLAGVESELRDAAVRLEEAAIDLRGRLTDLDADPGRLEQVEARLQSFADLEHRYGMPLADVLGEAAAAREALDGLAGSEERLAELAHELARREAAAAGRAGDLSAARAAAADPLARAVEAELAELGMPEARMEITLAEAELGPRGADRAEILLAANPGLPAGPLSQVASGGELSRIALALRVAARASGGPSTLLLDEVDAGVGGRTAHAVGERLRALAATAQVICITHLPQIASLADGHFRVHKRTGDPSATEIGRLDGDALVEELARMLGGDDDAALRHAQALRG